MPEQPVLKLIGVCHNSMAHAKTMEPLNTRPNPNFYSPHWPLGCRSIPSLLSIDFLDAFMGFLFVHSLTLTLCSVFGLPLILKLQNVVSIISLTSMHWFCDDVQRKTFFSLLRTRVLEALVNFYLRILSSVFHFLFSGNSYETLIVLVSYRRHTLILSKLHQTAFCEKRY